MFNKWLRICGFCKGRVNSDKGFTLIEFVMVFVVTSIMASAVVIPFNNNLNQGARPDIYSTAVQLAMADIEDQRLQGFNFITVPNGTVSAGSPTVINGRSYTRTVTTAFAEADFAVSGNSFNAVNPLTDDYIIVQATVTETTMTPNLSVTLRAVITPDYN